MNATVLDIYGPLSRVALRITEVPRVATIEFKIADLDYFIRLTCPRPTSALTEIFEDCWGIRIVDLNTENQNQLEFGRFRVEFWDEDGVIAQCHADSYSTVNE